ncbi:hypothetical protein NDU88_003286 [Pleurodeles waltl]|uniref:Uncharacterized protein n=1 Tax=Pleurodeles waltl TaxID=8319 RepID=A0AAV7P952_PLEWA|nr:hypothetical protein NDU88_003285 [Pleurodeles waltl]KAJ1124838.1 hypothetical protein NDU88_003286 [Pleurodeles waltl]
MKYNENQERRSTGESLNTMRTWSRGAEEQRRVIKYNEPGAGEQSRVIKYNENQERRSRDESLNTMKTRSRGAEASHEIQ